LETAIARIERSEGFMAAIFLDLDGFKHVNDSLGHGLGDELLVEVARRLREAVRPSDTVARLGGDEFVVLAEDLASREDAFALATRLRMSLATPFERAELKLSLSASIGVAVENQPDANPETLLRRADMAMYQAKTLGRDRIEFFEPDDRQMDGTGRDPSPLAARRQRASTPAT
jgi:diguanylate cyclase (GGDEF)-like protein